MKKKQKKIVIPLEIDEKFKTSFRTYAFYFIGS